MKKLWGFTVFSIAFLSNNMVSGVDETRYVNITEIVPVDVFERIKTYLLDKGDRKTFRNIDSNNPHLKMAGFDIFLGPEVRQNVTCDPELSDFNELIIYDPTKEIQYYHLVIVRRGDKSRENIAIPDWLEEESVYLWDPYEKDVEKMKEGMLPYLTQIMDIIG